MAHVFEKNGEAAILGSHIPEFQSPDEIFTHTESPGSTLTTAVLPEDSIFLVYKVFV